MNATEAAKLCAAIAQSAPAQKFDEDTPAFWAVLLADVRYDDARKAIIRLLQRQPFIGTSDIVTEVARIRADRISRTEAPTPNVDPDDKIAYKAEMAAIQSAIADGTFDPDAYASSGLALTGAAPMKAIGDGRKPDDLVGVSLAPERLERAVRSPEKPLPVDYGTRPVAYVKPVDPEEVARLEAERVRQLRALEATYGLTPSEEVPDECA